ncbi:hypothetical protein HBH96_117480 [Parastagonospora nodorum]|nr:hypothetical protein HBH96_117480 [Parastagonospora nodorum]
MSTGSADASTSTRAPPTTTSAPTAEDKSKSIPTPQNAKSKVPPNPKPLPSITGGCLCNTVRYRLLTSPLFSYACHCADCQRTSGTVFGHFVNIEVSAIRIISATPPIAATVTKRPGLISRHVECPSCKTELWSTNSVGPAVADVRAGTLDYPSLMEPDVHACVESKVEWVRLPEGARVVQGMHDLRKMWPGRSLRRLEVCLERWAREHPEEGREDGEKTPTATEVEGEEIEDDEAFEKRFRETERALRERLERLERKLEEEDRRGDGGLEEMTEKLSLGETGEVKDGIVSEPVD